MTYSTHRHARHKRAQVISSLAVLAGFLADNYVPALHGLGGLAALAAAMVWIWVE